DWHERSLWSCGELAAAVGVFGARGGSDRGGIALETVGVLRQWVGAVLPPWEFLARHRLFRSAVFQHPRAGSDVHGPAAAALPGGGMAGAGGRGLCRGRNRG